MKVQDIIQEFIPCEVCGNNDVHSFYIYITQRIVSTEVPFSLKSYIVCGECEEPYTSIEIEKAIINAVTNYRKKKIVPPIQTQSYFKGHKDIHPVAKILLGL